MSKKVKGFNVEDKVYNSLIKIFKKYGVKASLSAFVNEHLSRLLGDLQDIERALKEKNYKEFTVPMSFIIDSILNGEAQTEYEEIEGVSREDLREQALYTELEEWQYDYDSRRRKIPVPFLRYLSLPDAYELSSDKQFLIDKATGKKYTAGKTRNTIIPVKE